MLKNLRKENETIVGTYVDRNLDTQNFGISYDGKKLSIDNEKCTVYLFEDNSYTVFGWPYYKDLFKKDKSFVERLIKAKNQIRKEFNFDEKNKKNKKEEIKKIEKENNETLENQKLVLLKEIGNWYGDYEFKNGVHIIDNGIDIFKYTNVDEGLRDWLITLLEDGTHMWDPDIEFIINNCGGRITGVRVNKKQNGMSYTAMIDYPSKTRPGKTNQKTGGTFDNPTDAYIRRQELVAERRKDLSKKTRNERKSLRKALLFFYIFFSLKNSASITSVQQII